MKNTPLLRTFCTVLLTGAVLALAALKPLRRRMLAA